MSYNPEQAKKCIICGSKNFQILLTHRNDQFVQRVSSCQHQIRMVICKECGLVFQNPPLDAKTLAAIYSRKFRVDAPSEKYFRIIYPDAREKIQWIEHHLPKAEKRKVLDIGSSAGVLLNMFQKRQWDTFGVEPSLSFAEYSRKEYGLNVKTGFFQKITFPEIKFDLIVISHVLEHISDPIDFLSIAGGKLRDNGYLFIEVPDIRRPKIKVLYSSFFASAHLYLFSPATLKMILAKAGFKIISAANAQRGWRVLARKIEPSKNFYIPSEKDDYKKILRRVRYSKMQYLLAVAAKKSVLKIIRRLILKIIGSERARHFITALKKTTPQKRKKIALIVKTEGEIRKSLKIARRLSPKNEVLICLYDFPLRKHFTNQNLRSSVLPEEYLSEKAIDEIDYSAYQASTNWFLQNGQDPTLYENISLGKILQVPIFFYFKKTLEKIEMLLSLVGRNKLDEIIFFSDREIVQLIEKGGGVQTKFYALSSLSSGWNKILKLLYYRGRLVYFVSYLEKLIQKIKSGKKQKSSPEILFFYDKGFKILEPVREIAARKKGGAFEVITTGDLKIDSYLQKQNIVYSTLHSDLNIEPLFFLKKLFWLEKTWRKKIKSHPILNYRGINLDSKNNSLGNLWKKSGLSSLLYIEAAKRYFKQRKNLKTVVLPQDVWPLAKTITLIAQKNNIFTLVVQHGVTLDKEYYRIAYLPLAADKIAVWGEESKNYFLRRGVPENKIKITGFPGFDRLKAPQFQFNHLAFCERYSVNPKKKLILYATQNFSENKKKAVFENILEASRALPQIFFIVKLHPAPEETISFYTSILQEKKLTPKNILFLKDEDTLSLTQICDLLITVHSTVHIEAAILEKNIIIMNPDHDPELPIVRSKAALSAENPRELKESIKNILDNPKTQLELKSNRQKFVENYAFKNDGQASQRVWQLIK